MVEKSVKLTRITIEILTADRGHAKNVLKKLHETVIPFVVDLPGVWLDIHVCPEESEE